MDKKQCLRCAKFPFCKLTDLQECNSFIKRSLECTIQHVKPVQDKKEQSQKH